MSTVALRPLVSGSLWMLSCAASGCAIERITAVEWVEGGPDDSESALRAGDEATIDGGAADASGDGTPDSSSPPDGADRSPDSSSCVEPAFVTSSPRGIWSNGGYFVFNNVWNTAAGPGPQTLYACSYRSWYVVSNQTANDGAVKSYPNVQMNFSNVPLSSLHAVASAFAETSPHVGTYEVAYDVWLNGVATTGSSEIMVWFDNYNRVPTGNQVGMTTLGGRTYGVWKTSDNSYIALVSTAVVTSGTLDLLEIFNWTVSQGWLPSGSTLGQIDLGVEIVSTGGASATYHFDDFSITAN